MRLIGFVLFVVSAFGGPVTITQDVTISPGCPSCIANIFPTISDIPTSFFSASVFVETEVSGDSPIGYADVSATIEIDLTTPGDPRPGSLFVDAFCDGDVGGRAESTSSLSVNGVRILGCFAEVSILAQQSIPITLGEPLAIVFQLFSVAQNSSASDGFISLTALEAFDSPPGPHSASPSEDALQLLPLPEPETWAMTLSSLMALIAIRLRRNAR